MSAPATSDAAASAALSTLCQLFETPTFPDGRMQDPHHSAHLLQTTTGALAAMQYDPAGARDHALRLATSVWFLRCLSSLLEGGTTLSFTAPEALHLVLLAAPAAHAVVAEDEGLVSCLVGGASFRAELLQGDCVACLHALCVGPSRLAVSELLAGESNCVRVLLQCYGCPQWRAAAIAVLTALLATAEGRAVCARRRGELELHVLGGNLEQQFRRALDSADRAKNR